MNEQRAVAKLMQKKQPSVLTEQQKLFILEYMIDLNATQAAIRAGYPPATAAKVAHRLVKKGTNTGDAIARAIAERARRVGLTADDVLQRLGAIIKGDPRVMFNEDGSLRPPTEYSEWDALMLEGIKTRRIVEAGEGGKMTPVEIQEVKLTGKMPAITAAMRHLGLNNDKIDVNITSSLATRLDAAFKRTGHAGVEDEDADDEPDVLEGEFEDVTAEQVVLTPQQDEIARRLQGHAPAVHDADDDPLDLAAMLR